MSGREGFVLEKKKLLLVEIEQFPEKIDDSQLIDVNRFKYAYVSKLHSVRNEEILIVTFFSLKEKNAVFRVFFKHTKFITEFLFPERYWSESTLNTAVSSWSGSYYAIPANKQTEKQIRKFFSSADNSYDAMDKFQQDLRKAQLEKRHKRETDIIDEKMKAARKLPKDFENWLNEVVLNFSRYIYYKRVSTRIIKGYCTSCREQVEFKITKETPYLNVRHNQHGKCPLCNKELTFKAAGRTTRQYDIATAAYIQKTDSGFLIRYFSVHKKYNEHYWKPQFSFSELVRNFYNGNIITSYEYTFYKNTHKLRWCKANNIYQLDVACLYTRNIRRILADTDLKYSCIYELAKNSYAFNIYRYISAYRNYPSYEYLIKLRLYRLVAENLSWGSTNSHGLKLNGKGIQQVLGVNRLQFKQMQRLNGTYNHLSLIKNAGEIGISLKDDDLELFVKWRINHHRITSVLRYVTPKKIIKYINQNLTYWKKQHDKNSFQTPASDFVEYWDDYLQNCVLLGYDMKSSFILFPNELKVRHDEVMNLVEVEKKELLENAINSLYESLYTRFFFSWKGMFIRPPTSVDEIITEGHKLHHCVGTGRYIENMAIERCYILFIRNTNNPNKPFFTVAIQNERVLQCRGKHNCAMTNEVKRFINKWQKKIHGTAHEKQELFF
jgi:hypothetical protein